MILSVLQSRSVGPLYISFGPLIALRDEIYSVRNPTPEAPPRPPAWRAPITKKQQQRSQKRIQNKVCRAHFEKCPVSFLFPHSFTLALSSPGPTLLTNTQPKDATVSVESRSASVDRRNPDWSILVSFNFVCGFWMCRRRAPPAS
jgi:hypothetical protein